MFRNHGKKNGQALVLVTLALFAMLGLMGLAVDMGWSLYIEKTEQAGADAAALAAVLEALAIGGQNGPYTPGTSRSVTTGGSTYNVSIATNTIQPVACPANPNPITNMSNLLVACLHAKKHGFQRSNTRQNVTVELGDTSPPPLVPGVETEYWATVRIVERIPQLFSAVLGNTEGLVASVATAGVVDSVVIGSLLLINRDYDQLDLAGSKAAEPGLNLLGTGSGQIDIGGGIIIASSAHQADSNSYDQAARVEGTQDVYSQYVAIRGAGEYFEQGNNAEFAPKPTNGHSDGGSFLDPMRGKGQVPLFDPAGSAPQLPAYPVYGASMTPASFPGGVPPGIYYAANPSPTGPIASGQQIQISGDVTFVNAIGGNSTSGFSKWVFVGGLANSGPGNLTLAPGQYVFAGKAAGATHLGDFTTANPNITDNQTPNAAPSTAGEVFVLAGKDYPGLRQLINNAQNAPATLSTVFEGTGYGSFEIGSGNRDDVVVNLHGMNGEHADFPSWMEGFESVMLWQDQNNSLVDYDANGNIVCGNFALSCNNPDRVIPDDTNATMLRLNANRDFALWGIIYQPRGSFTHIQAGGADFGALQMVTGALRMQGGGNLNLGVLDQPLKRKVAALIR